MASFFQKGLSDYLSGLWQPIIRPPRDEYTIHDLGPEKWSLNGKYEFEREDLRLRSPRGLVLECSHWRPVAGVYNAGCQPSRLPCVVYLHTSMGSRREPYEDDQLILTALLVRGITVFAFDQSGSGLSGGEYISVGHYEEGDLRVVIEHLRDSSAVDEIGLWGRSMGAITAINRLRQDMKIGAAVIDSPFTNLRIVGEEMAANGTHVTIPKALISRVYDRIAEEIQSRAKFDANKIIPINHARFINCPALIVAAEADTVVLPYHAQEMHDAWKCQEKDLVYFQGDHWDRRPIWLCEEASDFLERHLVLKHLKRRMEEEKALAEARAKAEAEAKQKAEAEEARRQAEETKKKAEAAAAKAKAEAKRKAASQAKAAKAAAQAAAAGEEKAVAGAAQEQTAGASPKAAATRKQVTVPKGQPVPASKGDAQVNPTTAPAATTGNAEAKAKAKPAAKPRVKAKAKATEATEVANAVEAKSAAKPVRKKEVASAAAPAKDVGKEASPTAGETAVGKAPTESATPTPEAVPSAAEATAGSEEAAAPPLGAFAEVATATTESDSAAALAAGAAATLEGTPVEGEEDGQAKKEACSTEPECAHDSRVAEESPEKAHEHTELNTPSSQPEAMSEKTNAEVEAEEIGAMWAKLNAQADEDAAEEEERRRKQRLPPAGSGGGACRPAMTSLLSSCCVGPSARMGDVEGHEPCEFS
eukprot:TRINITY_DN50810_c0_g1_i1.p1 TRINITY_DN50810_c0_g1~~TRINITY_DN50810_c0_g1_i1.p1  ORF type:complete len:703 (-),score=192.23 TRINITY_DN50810_c0_g1_i1:51-2159(-)